VLASAAPSTQPSAPSTQPAALDPTAKARNAATLVGSLLADAAQTRSAVLAATGGLSSCTLDGATADQDLGQAIIERQQLLSRLATTSFAGLPHAAGLRTLLHRAWSQSLQADQAFLQWARDFESGGKCGTKDPSFTKGKALSASASKSKTNFAKAWNEYVAVPLQVPQVQEPQL
jgi:hypothetical protein